MLHACVQKFNVTKNLEIFLELNRAAVWTKLRIEKVCALPSQMPATTRQRFVCSNQIFGGRTQLWCLPRPADPVDLVAVALKKKTRPEATARLFHGR